MQFSQASIHQLSHGSRSLHNYHPADMAIFDWRGCPRGLGSDFPHHGGVYASLAYSFQGI